MDLEPSDDQTSLRDELRRFLTARVDHDARWAAAEQPGAVDRELWRELADMGVFGLPVLEEFGGVGLGWAEAAIVFEELGRAAVPGPLVATALAAALGLVVPAGAGGDRGEAGGHEVRDGPAARQAGVGQPDVDRHDHRRVRHRRS